MTDSNRALNEVPTLIEERRRYEGWLAALEARRDSTPAHVFDRVHSDYTSRLQQVVEKLAGYRDALEEERTSIQSRLSLLEAEEQMRRDERAELELRSQVGELSPEEAAQALGSLDGTLGELSNERGALREKSDSLRHLMGDGSAPASPPPKRVTGALGSAEAASARDSGAVGAKAEGRGTAPGTSSFDELAFLSSVVGEKPGVDPRRTPPRSAVQEKLPEPPAPEPASAPAPIRQSQPVPAPAPTRQSQPVPAPAPIRQSQPVPAPEAPKEAPPDDGAPEHDGSPMSGVHGSGTGVIRTELASESLLNGLAGGKHRQSGEGSPLAANVPGNTPIVLRASGAIEASKTLKCTECGSMNYATEWYCERCGAELAAL